jgi:hypothetical protein
MYNTDKREVPVDIFGHRTPGFGMMEVRFIYIFFGLMQMCAVI